MKPFCLMREAILLDAPLMLCIVSNKLCVAKMLMSAFEPETLQFDTTYCLQLQDYDKMESNGTKIAISSSMRIGRAQYIILYVTHFLRNGVTSL